MADLLQSSVEKLGVILDAIADGVTAQDPSGKIVYANEAAARAIGFASAQDLLAASVDEVMARFELIDSEGRPLTTDRLPGRLALRGQESPEMVVGFRVAGSPEVRWSTVKARPVYDDEGRISMAVNFFRDITDRMHRERELVGRARQQAAIAHLGQLALTNPPLEDLFQKVVSTLAETLEVEYAGVLEVSPDGSELVLRAGVGWEPELVGTMAVGTGLRSQSGLALLSPDPIIVEDVEAEDRFEIPPILAERGIRSGMSAVIGLRAHAYGVLSTHSLRPRRFTRDDVHFLQSAANLIGDSTQRARAEAEREQILEREREARAEAESMQWGLAFLAVASNVLAGSLDVETTLGNVARLVVPNFADWCVVHLAEAGGTPRQVALAHSDPERMDLATELQTRYPPDPHAPQGVGNVIRTGEAELYTSITDEMLAAAARDPEHLRLITELGLRSAMIVPMVARGRSLGTITLVAAESGRNYVGRDLGLAEDLARRAALAVDNARLFESTTRVAQTLQRSLLPPELPRIPGIEVAARYRPAGRGEEVGGDFYDLFETADGTWAAVMGDVCGKGLEAATLTGLARYTIRATAIRETRPSEVLTTLNEALLRQERDLRFCTVAYVRIRPGEGGARATVSSGGHPLPVLVRADASIHTVGRPGSLLGVFDDPELHDDAVDLGPGDVLVLYTDGVVEERAAGAVFGEERLLRLLSAAAGNDAATIADRIERAVMDFTPDLPRDDVAILVIRVLPDA